jgi:hypothetical protein
VIVAGGGWRGGGHGVESEAHMLWSSWGCFKGRDIADIKLSQATMMDLSLGHGTELV